MMMEADNDEYDRRLSEVSNIIDEENSSDMVGLIRQEDPCLLLSPLPSLSTPIFPRDLTYTLLFLLHIFLLLLLPPSYTLKNTTCWFTLITFSFVFAIFTLFGFLKSTKWSFWITLVVVSYTFRICILFFILGFNTHLHTLLSLLFCAQSVYDILWIIKQKDHFAFGNTLLAVISTLFTENKSLHGMHACIMICHYIWITYIAKCLLNAILLQHYFWIVVYLFHWYWFHGVCKGFLAFLFSGIVSLWYHGRIQSSLRPLSPTKSKKSGNTPSRQIYFISRIVFTLSRNALSTSLGTLVKASLQLPILSSFYPMAHVSSYNKPWTVATVDVKTLLQETGVWTILRSDPIAPWMKIIRIGSMSLGTLIGASCLSVSDNTTTFGSTLVIAGVVYSVLEMVTVVITSSITTLWVCFAENPKRLSQIHPIIYHRLVRISELQSFEDIDVENR